MTWQYKRLQVSAKLCGPQTQMGADLSRLSSVSVSSQHISLLMLMVVEKVIQRLYVR